MQDATDLSRHKREWNEVAAFNPEWAVLTSPQSKHAGWDMDAFFESGAAQVRSVLATAGEHGVPANWGSVLDFGCGVGRLSPELSARFGRYVGVDISETMLGRARELAGEAGNREFVLNDSGDLGRFEDGEFDAVVSFLVLQHMPNRPLIRSYIGELARVLAPRGLLAFQLLDRIPILYRTRVRGHLYRVARSLGVSVERAHRMGLQAMSVRSLPYAEVAGLLGAQGCRLLAHESSEAGNGITSIQYYATRD